MIPVGFTYHALVSCNVLFKDICPRSAYWRSNSSLLHDEKKRLLLHPSKQKKVALKDLLGTRHSGKVPLPANKLDGPPDQLPLRPGEEAELEQGDPLLTIQYWPRAHPVKSVKALMGSLSRLTQDGDEVKPAWVMLYRPPQKKTADLQWRNLNGAIAVNAFVSIINPASSNACPFCEETETLFPLRLFVCARQKLC